MGRNTNIMKKKDNKSPKTAHNTLTIHPIGIRVEEMSDKEFRKFIAKIFSEPQDDVMNELRENIQEVKEHFNIERF